MEDTIVLYATPFHINSIIVLAKFIADHHPSISVIIVSITAPTAVAAVPSITYRHLPAATLPPNLTTNPVELLFEIPRLHNPSLCETLQQISRKSRIIAFVVDFFCGHVVEVSGSLNIPTYFYICSGASTLCAFMYFPTIHETTTQDIGHLHDFVEVPGCSPIYSSDFPIGMFFRESKSYEYFLHCSISMRTSAGIIANSFDALEFKAKEALSNDLCTPGGKTPPVYLLGPLNDGKNSTISAVEHECLKWLDLQPSKSVIYLCFGRHGFFSKEQLMEMALGLENSKHRFLWAVRNPPGNRSLAQGEDPDLNELLPEGFLERTKDRGFVIKSFAPQNEILSHDSVAGFVTHCGWSSMLEAISFGVPMISWPLYAEQKMNRNLMEEMKVAMPLKAAEDGFVTAAELEKRVRELLESEKGKDVRERVGEMKIAAEAAVEEGGSSVVDLEKFVVVAIKE